MSRITDQLQFIMEADKIKNIFRKSMISDGSRYENDAEHSWHLALMAIVLAEHAAEDIDLIKVIKMVVIHDIVEIDAGDTFAYDIQGHEDKREREEAAAHRIFGLLPNDQKDEFLQLWEEFEDMNTPEARFATALDRMHPILLNLANKGEPWNKYNITYEMIYDRNKQINDGSETLWQHVLELLDECRKQGILKDKIQAQ